MDNNQPTTARALLEVMRRNKHEFHTQNPNKNADFDRVVADAYHDGIGMAQISINKDGKASISHVSTNQWLNESVRFEDYTNK